jgi:hypothetical protein
MITAPSPSELRVVKFCQTIRADVEPVTVPVEVAADGEVLDCFANVRRVVERSGGRTVFGWSIWEWRNIYLEAIHHAIYESPTGTLIDVTPLQMTNVDRILFLPDDTVPYDFENEDHVIRRDSHRLALRKDPLIENLFATKKAHDDFLNKVPGVGVANVSLADASRMTKVKVENARCVRAIGMKYTGRNDPCFCGSGIKFKKCHCTAAREV